MRLSAFPAALVAGLVGVAQADHESGLKSLSLRTHTIEKPFLDTDMQSRWFEFGGDAIIRTDSYIRLTSDLPSQSGWLFSRLPLTATNWEVEVEFQISGKHQLYGDGLAMWITKERGQRGVVFGSVDRFEGLGIFIDTYKNNRPGVSFPYVMAMHGDGQKSYNKNDDGRDGELAGCSARGIRHASVPTKLRLTYIQDKQLKLDIHYKEEGEWTSCFVVDKPPQIPTVAYLGFSAETGELSDNHDIISVTTKNLYSSPDTSGNGKGAGPSQGRNSNHGGSSRGHGTRAMFLTKLFLFIIVLVGGYIGYTAYRAKSRSHRF
ncbi:hypothetical protein E4U42_007915 [Claviceps africana]|uniref:L-type lectin-like domain-containing protein n=1 Tax=Claviceps africana TaxID=83212 RepID=A0A8K0J0U1_9HYPO|nr:hypothetical protein E4U42_007915 [Claviceps africana]